MKLGLSDQLTYNTFRLECKLPSGEISFGTCFLYRFEKNEKSATFLVTNKHVIKNSISADIPVNLKGEDGQPLINTKYIVHLDNFEKLWHLHPNPSIDLCIMPLFHLLEKMNNANKNIFCISIRNSHIPSVKEFNDLVAVEDIVMIGYPNALWDEINNRPITRKGITATHPGHQYQGRKEFVVDIASFPGSSGYPIFIYNSGSFYRKGVGAVVGDRLHFIGILYAGPQFNAEGEIVIEKIPTSKYPIVNSRIPMHLGFAINARVLLDFEDIVFNTII
jgi:hypothetical protein